MSRTRIKICGLTRPQDVRVAVESGADAIGFVFYAPSPRAVSIEQAAELVALLPPFVTSVGLFVNATAAEVARGLVERYMRNPLGEPMLLNVNVPDLAAHALQGVQVTRLGKRHKAEPVVRSQTPRGETVYWVGAAGGAADAGEGTDFHAVANGFVSVTPLQIDLTHTGLIAPVFDWLQQ